jgi:hypothetical protein
MQSEDDDETRHKQWVDKMITEGGGPGYVLDILAQVCESYSEWGDKWEKAAKKIAKLAESPNMPTIDDR